MRKATEEFVSNIMIGLFSNGLCIVFLFYSFSVPLLIVSLWSFYGWAYASSEAGKKMEREKHIECLKRGEEYETTTMDFT